MDAVAQQPISVAIEADKRVFQNYQSGVLSKIPSCKILTPLRFKGPVRYDVLVADLGSGTSDLLEPQEL